MNIWKGLSNFSTAASQYKNHNRNVRFMPNITLNKERENVGEKLIYGRETLKHPQAKEKQEEEDKRERARRIRFRQ